MIKRTSTLLNLGIVFLLTFISLHACTFNVANNPDTSPSKSQYILKEVIDGDTIRLEDGRLIRYMGINTPEKGQNFYQEAKDLNLKLLKESNLPLELDIVKKDQYDRSLAYVYVGDSFINLKLIEAGLAFCFSDSSNKNNRAMFRYAQQEAQKMELGMWKKSPHSLSILSVQYDAVGDDESNINGEWVSIKNIGKRSVQLQGFAVQDESHHRFVFPKRVLVPGEEVSLFSGKGTHDAMSLFWGSDKPLWNNQGDTVFLFDDEGRLIDSWFWET
jgi:micrococcal nuclease